MDLNVLDIFKGISAKMAWLTQRQNVIAQNISNVDTANYKALDIAPFAFHDALKQRLTPQRTNPLHLASAGSSGPSREEKERKPYEVTPSGNSVSLEEQMQKAATVSIDFQMITTLYQKNIGLIKTALDRGAS